MRERESQPLDKPTLWGIAFCGVPVLSYSSFSQFEAATSAGVPSWLAWVLPMATDATACVATRAWLIGPRGSGLRRYAAFLSLICMALSFAGAALHLVLLGDTTSPWWMRMTIGGLPSLALAALIHLAALMGAIRRPAASPKVTRPTTPRRGSVESRGAAAEVDPPTTPARPRPAADAPSDPPSPSEPAPPVPTEVGASAVAELAPARTKKKEMVAFLNGLGDEDLQRIKGADLDQKFGTKSLGRAVLREFRTSQQAADATRTG